MNKFGDFKFEMSDEEMAVAFTPAFARNFNPKLNSALAEATMNAVAEGDERAYYIPVINFGIQSAIRSLKIPSVRERLPAEIRRRSLIAERIGSIVAQHGIEQDTFIPAYAKSEHLRQGLNERTMDKLQNPQFIAGYFQAPWFEASQVMGGAFEALGKQGIYEGRDQIIANSRGLQVVALVPALEGKKRIIPFLGSPYADSEHFNVHTHEMSTSVVFNKDALDFIGQYLVNGRGCPAAEVHPQDAREGSLLQRSFAEMAEVLLFGDAVATYLN